MKAVSVNKIEDWKSAKKEQLKSDLKKCVINQSHNQNLLTLESLEAWSWAVFQPTLETFQWRHHSEICCWLVPFCEEFQTTFQVKAF